jgi:hypothetical protein
VYPEVSALVGLLMARIPLSPDGRTGRLLAALVPVVLAGALVLLAGGVVARMVETAPASAAFAYGEECGVYPPETEPGGRSFRWTSGAAAWRVDSAGAPRRRFRPSQLVLPVKNARPDGAPLVLTVFWEDVRRGSVRIAAGRWQLLELSVTGPGVLRVEPSAVFEPASRLDRRTLGFLVGEPVVIPRTR